MKTKLTNKINSPQDSPDLKNQFMPVDTHTKDILDCLDEEWCIQIDDNIKRTFRYIHFDYQYLCLRNEPDCNHYNEIEGTPFCTGNWVYGGR